MASNPLHPENVPTGRDRITQRGHGTGALGPSDSSDSGSDVQGAGAQVGDANLDSDSDRNGTGERASVGSEVEATDGRDIDVDKVEGGEEEEEE